MLRWPIFLNSATVDCIHDSYFILVSTEADRETKERERERKREKKEREKTASGR